MLKPRRFQFNSRVRWVDHAFEELDGVVYLKRKINSVHSGRVESSVVNVRRDGVHHRQTDQSADHRFVVDRVEMIKRAQLASVDLAWRCSALIVQSAVG